MEKAEIRLDILHVNIEPQVDDFKIIFSNHLAIDSNLQALK